jgi:class 3 adenylate cyclase
MDLKNTFLTTCLLFSCFVFAQNRETSSASYNDSTDVNALLALSKENFGNDPDKAIAYSVQARALADKIDYKKGAAIALKNIGIANYYQGKNVEALGYYQQSLQIFQFLKDDNGVSNLLNNIGAIYMNQGDDATALEYYLKSLQMAEKTGDKLRILTATTNIGAVYSHHDSTLNNALVYYMKAIPLAEDLQDKQAIGTIATNIGEIHILRHNDSLAVLYLKKALKALNNSENSAYAYNALAKLYATQGNHALALQTHQKALASAEKLNAKLDIVQSLQGLGKTYMELGNHEEALKYYKRAEPIAKEIEAPLELMRGDSAIAASYAVIGDFKNAHQYHVQYANYKDTLYNNEKDKKIAKLQFDFDLQKKQGEIAILKKDNTLREMEIKRQRFAKNAVSVGLVLLFILAFFIYRNYRIKVKSNKILDKKNMEIENLLLNILPAEVATELQSTGRATPRYFNNVSVLFTDFKGFTSIADKMSPEEVVAELNTCFMAFDSIVEKHDLEKIKTIGDSYMCAGGIPTLNKDHVCNMINASLEMLVFMEQYNKQRLDKGLAVWDIRIGVHVGPVVAGVVGKKKYAYDIWGSTVNIASRMESNGYPGLVNISAATYEQIKDQYACDYRGKVYAKNVGDIDMYFVSPEQIEYTRSQPQPLLSDSSAKEVVEKPM